MNSSAGTIIVSQSSELRIRRLRRFFRSPKGYLLLALIPLAALAAPDTGVMAALVDLAAAVLGATLLELVCARLEDGAWRVPSSALLSGLLVGLVLSAQEPWYVAAAAGVLATGAKHTLRPGRVHIFNPAAFGLLAVYLLFSSGQSWWGALPGLPLPVIALLIVVGALVAQRANKLPAALTFLGVYLGAFTLAAIFGHAAYVADIFRAPFINMAVFFGFFMVTDPPTSPVPFPAQCVFGSAVALVSFTAYMATRGLVFLLVGVLVANAGYAAWQLAVHMRRRGMTQRPARRIADGLSGRAAGAGLGAAGIALVVLLAAGVALTRHSSGVAAGAGPQTAAAPTRTAQPAARAALPLSFQDSFTGTIAQSPAQGGATIDIAITGSGQRPVQLTMHLLLTQGAGRRSRALENQATLSDQGGVQICQGQVMQMDNTSFSVQCDGSGQYAGTSLLLSGTIASETATRIQGDLQVAPSSG